MYGFKAQNLNRQLINDYVVFFTAKQAVPSEIRWMCSFLYLHPQFSKRQFLLRARRAPRLKRGGSRVLNIFLQFQTGATLDNYSFLFLNQRLHIGLRLG